MSYPHLYIESESSSYSSTSSYTISASYIIGGGGTTTGSFTGSFTGSLLGSASYALVASTLLGSVQSASYASTSSYVTNAITASYVAVAQTASYVLTSSYARTASYVLSAITASYIQQATSASFAISANNANLLDNRDSTVFASTGSNNFTGSQFITGSVDITGSFKAIAITGSYTGSLTGVATTASYVILAQTASYVIQAISASYYGGNVISSSYAGTASLLLGSVQSASYAGTASLLLGSIESASYAATASYAVVAQTLLGSVESASFASTASSANLFIVRNNLYVTNSIDVTGSIKALAFTGSYTGSLTGIATTASYVVTAQTASYVITSQTASYVLLAQTSSLALRGIGSFSGSFTGSFIGNFLGTGSLTGSLIGVATTASYVVTAQTASYVVSAITASYVAVAQTASYVLTAQTASYVLQAVSSSYSTTASYAISASWAPGGGPGITNTGSFTGSFIGDHSGSFSGSYRGDGSQLTGVVASAAPGGPNNAIQVNVAGVTSGSGDFTYDYSTNTLFLSGSNSEIVIKAINNEPSSPPAGSLALYSKEIAGRLTPKFKGPSGLDTPLQSALWSNNIYLWTISGVTAGLWLGTVGAGAGTFKNIFPNHSGSLYNTVKRSGYANVITTANQVLGQRNTEAIFFVGTSSTAPGGFFFYTRCGFDVWTNGDRFFAGMATGTTVISADPTSLNNTVGFSINAADNGSIKFLTRNATTFTTASTGITAVSNRGYDIYIFAPPQSTTIHWRIVDFVNNIDVSGSANTTIPTVNTMLTANVLASNGANTAVSASVLGINRIYIDTDY